MDRELHQRILQMFEEDSDEEDFLGFTDSGMEEENLLCTSWILKYLKEHFGQIRFFVFIFGRLGR